MLLTPHLAGNSIGDAGMRKLGFALQTMTMLEHLNLSANQLGLAASLRLGATLSALLRLQRLDLSGTMICVNKIPALFHCLSQAIALGPVAPRIYLPG